MIIENVPKNLDLMREVFAELDTVVLTGIIIATNSSSIPASRIAVATARPEYILIVNFTDPTEVEFLVEVMFHE